MKKTILLLATILFTLSAKSQEEFSRAYLNVLISYEDSLSYYDGANAFTFNVDGIVPAAKESRAAGLIPRDKDLLAIN